MEHWILITGPGDNTLVVMCGDEIICRLDLPDKPGPEVARVVARGEQIACLPALLAACDALVHVEGTPEGTCDPNAYVCPHCDAPIHDTFQSGRLVATHTDHLPGCALVCARAVIAKAK